MLEVNIDQNGEVRNVLLDLEEVIIGRQNDSREVHLDLTPDESVSRVHARVWVEGDVIFIEDLDSSGGTYIEGCRINTRTKLETKSKAKIGEVFLDFRLHSPDRKIKETSKERSTVNQSSDDVLPASGDQGIHVELNRGGETSRLSFDLNELFVGRKHPDREIHIDLNSDLKASRIHARVWRTRNICWIEDLSSTHGTLVNGEVLNGARVIKPNDVVQIGETKMQFRYGDGCVEPASQDSSELSTEVTKSRFEDECAFEDLDTYPVYKEENYRYHLPDHRKKSDLESVFMSRKSPVGRIRISYEVKLNEPYKIIDGTSEFLSLLPDIISQISELSDKDMLSEWFVNTVSDWIPEAERASVFTVDGSSGRINLLAHKPALKPVVSDMLAHRALEIQSAYAWEQVGKDESVRRLAANSGIYVPLFSMGEELGFICVEKTAEGESFSILHLSALVLVGKIMSIPLGYNVRKDTG